MDNATDPLLALLQGPSEWNPLLQDQGPPVVDCAVVSPAVIRRQIPARRVIEDQRRKASAAAVVAQLARDGSELYGLTKGQFSLADLLAAILEKTGPAEVGISTWTAANSSIGEMLALLQSGKITRCRWLVDQTFIRRAPALVAEIRRKFGDDAIRVTKTHAKFAVVRNEDWQIALRSSMNLNQNPRLESFEVGHDPQLCGFLTGVLDQIWAKQARSVADGTSQAASAWFAEHG